MTRQTPRVRQISWAATLPQLALLVVGFLVARHFYGTLGVVGAAGLLLAYSYGTRYCIAHHHRQGIELARQREFAAAIPLFEQSLEFFDRHSWLDRWRWITLMSSAAASYREMDLVNIGYCYGQLGDSAKAREYYEQALARFPESGLASSALRKLDEATASRIEEPR